MHHVCRKVNNVLYKEPRPHDVFCVTFTVMLLLMCIISNTEGRGCGIEGQRSGSGYLQQLAVGHFSYYKVTVLCMSE